MSLPLVGLALSVLLSGAADGRAFVDSRDRFRVQLPPGWELAPQPGDTEGMVFRRKSGDVPGIIGVKVAPLSSADTHASVMDARGKSFERELGYDRLAETDVRVGDLVALRRVHTVFLNGDAQIRRYSVDHVLLSCGYGHYIHFETAEGHYPQFQKDLELFLRAYTPLAGRKAYAPLVGRWLPSGGGTGELVLGLDQRFEMGKRSGWYRLDGRRLILSDALGTDRFTYTVEDSSLLLSGDGAREPLSYKRAGATRGGEPMDEKAMAQARRELRVTRDLLVGTWVVVDGGEAHDMVFSEGGSMRFGPMSGRYTVREQLLSIESSTGVRITYHVSFDGRRLHMEGGDLDRALVLERRP